MIQARFSPRRRIAFTLVELLVVIALILVIFGLGAGYIVYGQNNNHTVMASQAVTGAMLNAKQRARRDGLPTGIRILFSNNVASQLQLIQQPEDYNAGWCQSDPNNDLGSVVFSGVDFLGGAATLGEVDEATIQVGDYFTAAGSGVVHRITQVKNPPNGFAGAVELASPLSSKLQAGTGYAIIRGPRKLPSEDLISLPPTMIIDGTVCLNVPISSATNTAEILFAPSGGVVGQGTGANKILLWLRDPSQPTANGGSPLLVSIQVRTGSIEAYPVAPGPNWYSYANDPRYSGS